MNLKKVVCFVLMANITSCVPLIGCESYRVWLECLRYAVLSKKKQLNENLEVVHFLLTALQPGTLQSNKVDSLVPFTSIVVSLTLRSIELSTCMVAEY